MSEFLPILLYVLGSILLVVLIILGIKLIVVVDKINITIDNINTKIEALDGIFSIIDSAGDKLSLLSSKLTSGIVSLLKNVFNKKKEEEYEDE